MVEGDLAAARPARPRRGHGPRALRHRHRCAPPTAAPTTSSAPRAGELPAPRRASRGRARRHAGGGPRAGATSRSTPWRPRAPTASSSASPARSRISATGAPARPARRVASPTTRRGCGGVARYAARLASTVDPHTAARPRRGRRPAPSRGDRLARAAPRASASRTRSPPLRAARPRDARGARRRATPDREDAGRAALALLPAGRPPRDLVVLAAGAGGVDAATLLAWLDRPRRSPRPTATSSAAGVAGPPTGPRRCTRARTAVGDRARRRRGAPWRPARWPGARAARRWLAGRCATCAWPSPATTCSPRASRAGPRSASACARALRRQARRPGAGPRGRAARRARRRRRRGRLAWPRCPSSPTRPPRAPFRCSDDPALDLDHGHVCFTTRRGGCRTGAYATLNLGPWTDDDPARRRREPPPPAALAGRRGSAGPPGPRHARGRRGRDAGRGRRRPGRPPTPASPRRAGRPTACRSPWSRPEPSPWCTPAGAGWPAGSWPGRSGAARPGRRRGAVAAALGPARGAVLLRGRRRPARARSARSGRTLDLPAIARGQLHAAGVDEVHRSGAVHDVRTAGLFFSHRRDGGVTGRQAGIAWRQLIRGLDAARVARQPRRVHDELAAAGREPGDVQVLAATKYVAPRSSRSLAEAGLRLFGENRAQDLAAKTARSAPGAGSRGTSSATCSRARSARSSRSCAGSTPWPATRSSRSWPGTARARPRCSSRSTWPATRQERGRARRARRLPRARALPRRRPHDDAARRRAPGGQPAALRGPRASSPPTAACPSSPWARRRTSAVAAEEGATVVRLGSTLFR